MSILDSVQPIDKPSDAEIIAKQIIAQTRGCFLNMVRSFNEGARLFWDNPRGVEPSEIAAALGKDAKEIFELHYALGQFISDVKPESIILGISLIGQFIINEDGTVTVIEPVVNDQPVVNNEPEITN